MTLDTLAIWPAGLLLNICIFALTAAAIAVGGVLLTVRADIIADRSGWGEAITGGVLLGASTSISGAMTSMAAAAADHPDLALSNAVGGIAAQTAFLAVADLTYRKANLEHAAASTTNLFQAALLILLLSLPVMTVMLPALTVAHLHVASPVILIVYLLGLRASARSRQLPMWQPVQTGETRRDDPEERSLEGPGDASLYAQFAALVVLLSVAGIVIAHSGLVISRETSISESVVGALLTAVTTSLPELVTTLVAVRRGALQLAVGGIIGGNTFDVLFLVLSDASYTKGSIYHAADAGFLFWCVMGIIMTSVLLLGLIRRERHGPGNIGFESVFIFLIYGAGVCVSVLR